MASNYKGISKQKVTIKKPNEERYFFPGDFVCEVNRASTIVMQDNSIRSFAELKVIESNSPIVKVGDIREYWRDFKFKDSAQKELKTLVCSAMDLDPDECSIEDEDFDTFFPEGGDDSPLIGKTVKFNVYNKEGSTFPKFKFYAK